MKAVEIGVVYEDGTVERWSGEKAARVWSALDFSWLDSSEKPSTTKPLRRVTTTRATHVRHDGEFRGLAMEPQAAHLELFPDGMKSDAYRKSLFEVRIVVEAIPVVVNP